MPRDPDRPDTWIDGDGTWVPEEQHPRPEPEAVPPPFGDHDERYDEGELIGYGGLGRVSAVHDALLEREVARKELRVDRPELRERFVREARITARLDHPNIVPVHDAGQDRRGQPYYTMKRLQGRSLAEVLGERLDPDERRGLLDRVVQVCNAVAYAHDRGVVHRDLKPENIMLGGRGETWVVDWGLSGDIGESDAISGTVGWMAPEQARGAPFDPRADVWSLGAILYAVLAGRPAIEGDSAEEVLARTRSGPVSPMASAAPWAPAELCAIVDTALAFDAADRYADAGALADDLQGFLADRWVAAYRYSTGEVLLRLARRHWRAMVLTAAVSSALLGLWGLQEWRVRAERDEAIAARLESDRALALALEEQAVAALSSGDDVRAMILATEALLRQGRPESRGVVLRAGASWVPRLERTLPTPTPCSRELMLAGDRVLCVGDELAVVLDLRGRELWRREASMFAGALSADGQRVAWIEERRRLYSQPVAGTTPPHLMVEDPEISAVGPSPDGQWQWAGRGTVTDERGVRRLGCASAVVAVDPHGTGTLATCVNGQAFKIEGDRVEALRERRGVTYVTVIHDGSVIAGDHETLRLGTGADAPALALGGYPVSLAAHGPWLAAGTDHGDVWLVHLQSTESTRLPAHVATAHVAFDERGQLWTAGEEGLRVWSLPPLTWSTLHDVHDVAGSPDGSTLALGRRDGAVELVDAASGLGEVVRSADGDPVWVAFAADDRLLVGSEQAGVFERLGDGGWRLVLPPDGGAGVVALFALGERVVAVGSASSTVWVRDADGEWQEGRGRLLVDPSGLWREVEGGIERLDLQTLESTGGVVEAPDDLLRLASSPSGRRVVMQTRGAPYAHLVELDTGRVLDLPAHQLRVGAVRWLSEDRVATASWDGRVHVSDLHELPQLVARLSHDERVLSMERLGDDLLTSSWVGELRRHHLEWLTREPAAIAAEVRASTGYGFVDGRVRFVGVAP